MISQLWKSYFNLLQTTPMSTNVSTAFVVGYTGDMLAQKLESDNNVQSFNDISHKRSLKVGIAFIISAFPMYYWYRFLDGKFPTTLSKGLPIATALRRVIPKVASNQCVAAPINNSFTYMYITTWDHFLNPTAFEHPNKPLWDKMKEKWLKEMPTTTKYSFMIWGPLHTFNFLFLPTQTRILFNSVGSTCWIAYLSIRAHDRQKIIEKKEKS
jgi:hypothetical protein